MSEKSCSCPLFYSSAPAVTVDAAAAAVGSAAGGVLAGVADTAKGLLGALMGPFEREGAFDESTAALTGAPSNTANILRVHVSEAGWDGTAAHRHACKHDQVL